MTNRLVNIDENTIALFSGAIKAVLEKLSGREIVIVISVFVAGWIVSKAMDLGYNVDVNTEDIAHGKCRVTLNRVPEYA